MQNKIIKKKWKMIGCTGEMTKKRNKKEEEEEARFDCYFVAVMRLAYAICVVCAVWIYWNSL